VVGVVLIGVNREESARPAAARPTPPPARPSPTPSPPTVLDVQFVSAQVGFAEIFAGEPARIYRTGDGGSHWSVAWEGPPVRFKFFDPEHGIAWAQAVGSLLTTADGGADWALRQWPKPGSPAAAAFATPSAGLAVFPGPAGLAFGAQPAVVYRTADGGQSWTPTATLYGPSDRAPAVEYVAGLGLTAGGLAWLLFDAGLARSLWVSRDGGTNWSEVALPDAPEAGLVDPVLQLDGGSGSLVLTTQWVPRSDREVVPGDHLGTAAYRVPTYLYALGSGGQGWQPLQLPVQPFGEFAAALGAGGAGFSLGGTSDCWIAAMKTNGCTYSGLGDVAVDRLDFLAPDDLVAVDHRYGGAYRSTDGGTHWSLVALPLGS
jgi:photosystem II stability/assembly factor-like uncharacterized protein